ncbi:MAG: hypothetical protein JST50_22745 [Bacteroidetes bacterium]|jgi:hypothetical protein|nr:hypothetical protein [Bacteroidota bacterium]
MRKNLARLILVLFLLSVICPVGLSASGLRTQQTDENIQFKTSEHLSSTAKILSHTNTIDFTAYGKIKPLWTGNMNTSGEDITVICHTLFIQNSRSGIHCQQLFKRLLFPFHFFG